MNEKHANNPPSSPGRLRAAGTVIPWVMAVYFCSGFCSLVDEVVWVRLLKLTLGNTVYASSIVVSVFMGGLALGALIMARFADRVKNPLKLYAILEGLAAVSALAIPWALKYADGMYQWFFAGFQPSPAGVTIMQVAVSALILLVPTMVMGSTLPLLGRYVTRLNKQVGRLVGGLYALNMLGAALGCYLAGYVLIRHAGVMGTLYIAAAVNLLVAAAGYVLSRIEGAIEAPAPTESAPPSPGPFTGEAEGGGTRGRLLLLGFFASGMISIGYELIWMRSIVFLLGNFTYVFSAVLTVYLLGNVIGAWLGSRLSRRLERPAAAFGISLAVLGLLGVGYIPWLRVLSGAGGALKSPDLFGTYAPLFFCCLLFLVPSAVMGFGFPLALQAFSRRLQRVGQTTGIVYGINTIGAVLGGALTGFILIPLVGAQRSITYLGLAGIWIGAAMLFTDAPAKRKAWKAAAAAAVPILTAAAFLIPSDLFEQWFLGFGQFKFIEAKEGITTTITVYEGGEGALTLATSGVVVAGDGREIRSAQKALGHLGVFMDKNAADVLSIGFGSGETTWCLAQHDLERIDCVEIAPELVEMALKYFKHINLGKDLDRKVALFYMDGKNYIHLTDRRYDVIINGADVPHQPGSAPMFAKEHFERTRDHLKPGGVFITKMHLASVSRSSFDSILGTFLEVFPHVSIWFPTTKPYFFFYLAGSMDPQRFSPVHIDRELARKGAEGSFAFMNLRSSHDVLTWYIGDKHDIERYLGDYRINSDYTPFVEFNLDDKGMRGLAFFLEFVQKVRGDSIFDHIDGEGMTPAEQETWLKEQERYHEAAGFLLEAHGEILPGNKLKLCCRGLRWLPESAALRELEDKVLADLGTGLTRGAFIPDKLIEEMDVLLQDFPDSGAPWLVKSWAFQRKKNHKAALDAAEWAVEYAPYSARTHDNLGVLLMKDGADERALGHLEEAVKLNPADPSSLHHLGAACARLGKTAEAIDAIGRVLALRPENTRARCDLAELLKKEGRIDEATEHLNEALRFNPDHKRARALLKRMPARRPLGV